MRPEPHAAVNHPRENLEPPKNNLVGYNDRLLDWVTTHVLASVVVFDVALIVPLLAIPLNDSVKITLGVISGSWIQWWALHALQRSQVKADLKREAKMDSDHAALTHIANSVDQILAKLGSVPSYPSA